MDAPAVLEPVAGRAAGMIERCGAHRDAGPGIDRVAGAEVVEFKFGLQRIDLERKERKAHQLSHRLLDAAGGLQVAGPDADDLILHEQRREERQADEMIDVAVAEKDIEVGACSRLRPARCRARRIPVPASKIRVCVAAAHLHAGGVAAIAQGRRAGAGDAAPDAPELNRYGWRRADTSFKAITEFRIPTKLAQVPGGSRASQPNHRPEHRRIVKCERSHLVIYRYISVWL